ncbi:MAG: hypothetical protein LBT15_07270, partial [Synergistaceae bacterium]|nr:hypothetical protein [Synergistaceae bacterium]
MPFSVLTVNPGSTSTKVAKFSGATMLWNETIRHTNEELAPFGSITEQFDFRLNTILDAVDKHACEECPEV